MCDIVSGLMIASSVVGAYGTIQSGNAQAAAANYNAQIQAQNAAYADQRARDALERGRLEEERVRREGTLVRKGQEAAFGAAGLDLGYGSPMDAILASATQAEMDALMTRENAAREAEDFEREAWSLRSGAELSRMEGRAAKTAARVGAIGSVLGGTAGAFQYRASIK